MRGKEVFRHAVVNLADVLVETMDALGLTPGDIDWVVPHQANMRILQGTAKKLGLAPEKVVVTVDRHANTSAASVPLALDEAVRSEEHTSELQSLMRISYAVFCLKKKKHQKQ